MPLTRQQKEQAVQEVAESISGATSVVFVAYDALNVMDMNDLRNKLYAEGCKMRVVPKRLLRLAAKNAQSAFDPVAHEGQIAAVWGEDAVAPAKVLYEFAKEHEQVQLLAGVLEGEDVSLQQVKSLAQLPSREQLLGQLVGTLAGPMRGLAGVLSGVQRQTVYVLTAIKDQKSA